MEDTTPLLLIALTLVGFWLIGKILTRSYRQVHREFEQKSRGIKIAEDLHVTSLSDQNIETFVSLIRSKKEAELAAFFAKYRPHLTELEEFLTALREQYHHAIPKGASARSPISPHPTRSRPCVRRSRRDGRFGRAGWARDGVLSW